MTKTPLSCVSKGPWTGRRICLCSYHTWSTLTFGLSAVALVQFLPLSTFSPQPMWYFLLFSPLMFFLFLLSSQLLFILRICLRNQFWEAFTDFPVKSNSSAMCVYGTDTTPSYLLLYLQFCVCKYLTDVCLKKMGRSMRVYVGHDYIFFTPESSSLHTAPDTSVLCIIIAGGQEDWGREAVLIFGHCAGCLLKCLIVLS